MKRTGLMRSQTGRMPKGWTRRSIGELLVVGALALAAASVSACGNTASSSSGGTGGTSAAGGTSAQSAKGVADARAYLAAHGGAPRTITVSAPLRSKPPAGKLLIFFENTESPQSAATAKGYQQAAAAIGWRFRAIGFQASNAQSLQSDFQSALQMHPAVVVEQALPESAWGANTIPEYAKAGALIVAQSVYPCKAYDNVLCSPDGYAPIVAHGKLLGAWFVADSDGHGTALVEHAAAYPILDAFTSGFNTEVGRTCPGCHVNNLDVTLQEISGGHVPSVLVNQLRTQPADKYLLFDDGPFSTGITSALAAAQINDVKVGGEAATTEQFAQLRAGKETAWTVQNDNYQGWIGLDMALRRLEGMASDPGDELMPIGLLTRENVGGLTTNWSQPANVPAQFLRLWHIA